MTDSARTKIKVCTKGSTAGKVGVNLGLGGADGHVWNLHTGLKYLDSA